MHQNLQNILSKLNTINETLNSMAFNIKETSMWIEINKLYNDRKKYNKKYDNLVERIEKFTGAELVKQNKIKEMRFKCSEWYHVHPFIETEAYLIVVGRNQESSERLRKRYLPTDYYLHAYGIKGGSILLRLYKQSAYSEAIAYSKALALLYSSLWSKFDALSGPVIITTGDLIVKYAFKKGLYSLKKYKLEVGEINFKIYFDKITKSVNFLKGEKLGTLIRNEEELAPIVKKLILEKYNENMDLNYLVTVLPMKGNII